MGRQGLATFRLDRLHTTPPVPPHAQGQAPPVQLGLLVSKKTDTSFLGLAEHGLASLRAVVAAAERPWPVFQFDFPGIFHATVGPDGSVRHQSAAGPKFPPSAGQSSVDRAVLDSVIERGIAIENRSPRDR
jgi:hypothetical protein